MIQTISSTGSAFGALFAGKIAYIGRWNCIMLSNVMVVTGCGLTLIRGYTLMLVGRCLFGAAAGSFSVFCTKYISEVAPTHLRGTSGACCQCGLTMGILIPFSIGLYFDTNADPKNDPTYLTLLLTFPILLSALQMILLLTVFKYDTPYELKKNGQT